jgi:hypothetical protein
MESDMLRLGKWEGEQTVMDRYTRVEEGLGRSETEQS